MIRVQTEKPRTASAPMVVELMWNVMNFQLYYLLGAGLLCMLTGYLYERDGNIWGAVLIHLTVGFMPRALGLY